MGCSCGKCEGLILREGEVADTYGGDFTWEDTRFCLSRGIFETRGYGALEWDWRQVEPWMAESLRGQFAAKIAEAEASAIEEASGPGRQAKRPSP